jgi:hypothetical protein
MLPFLDYYTADHFTVYGCILGHNAQIFNTHLRINKYIIITAVLSNINKNWSRKTLLDFAC